MDQLPIQDQNQHYKPFYTHSLNPPTLNKYTNSPVQPPQSSPPSLSLPSLSLPTHRLTHPNLSNPPKTTTLYSTSPTLIPYTLDLIQPTRPDSPHLPLPHKHPYPTPTPKHHPSQLFTSPSPLHQPHPHTVTHEANKIPPKQNTKK